MSADTNAALVLTDVVVRPYTDPSSPKLRAFVDLTYNGALVIHDAKLIRKDGRYFVSMPARRGKDGVWRDYVHPTTPELRDEIERQVLSAYWRELNGSVQ